MQNFRRILLEVVLFSSALGCSLIHALNIITINKHQFDEHLVHGKWSFERKRVRERGERERGGERNGREGGEKDHNLRGKLIFEYSRHTPTHVALIAGISAKKSLESLYYSEIFLHVLHNINALRINILLITFAYCEQFFSSRNRKSLIVPFVLIFLQMSTQNPENE